MLRGPSSHPARPEGASHGPDDRQPPPKRALERTLVLVKPDGVQRGLIGSILQRFESKGLRIVGLKLRKFPDELIREHYAVHSARPFYASLVRFMTSGPVAAIALEGENAIAVTRNLVGATNGQEAAPGTIRGDYGMSVSYNLVHGSDGPESSAKELSLFFGDDGDLCDWTPTIESWVYDQDDKG